MDDTFYKQSTLVDISSPKEQLGPVPSKIGPYKIESLLSHGGMSILYLGLHPETKQMLAIKVLSPEFVTHPEMIERFLKEAKIIGMTNHPNIVKLYGQGTWEGGLYIAMEFIRGVSLRQFIAQQSLSLKRCVDIILQVAYALCHLHTHGVIHGDLKPENILINEDGEVKVIDFGIARLHEEMKKGSSSSLKIAGTPTYMSPEQKEDPSKISFASDIYALGIIAYELAMGKLSYGVIHLSLLPKGLRKIIEKALAVSVKERYQDIVVFITDLSQYLKSGGIEKDRPGTDELKEVLETIQGAALSLSPSSPPSWPNIEIGIAKYRGPAQTGGFYDFFRFSDGSYAIVIAEAEAGYLEESVYIGILRGMIRFLLQNRTPAAEAARVLNRLACADPLKQRYGFSYLTLDPVHETLSFISCGMGSLFHISQGTSHPRKLASEHPLLGADINSDFFETADNWDIGNMLALHSLDASLEPTLLDSLSENTFLSAQGQAEAAFKRAAAQPSFGHQKNPKLLIAVHRIG